MSEGNGDASGSVAAYKHAQATESDEDEEYSK